MWYAANLMYKSTQSPLESKPTIWEESILIIEAKSEAEARDEAERIGQGGTHSYEVEGGLATWTFEAVDRVYAIHADVLQSGCEVFSRFLRESEVKSLRTPFDDD
jgi:hypothetical protein